MSFVLLLGVLHLSYFLVYFASLIVLPSSYAVLVVSPEIDNFRTLGPWIARFF